jgi:hypothetical protein
MPEQDFWIEMETPSSRKIAPFLQVYHRGRGKSRGGERRGKGSKRDRGDETERVCDREIDR